MATQPHPSPLPLPPAACSSGLLMAQPSFSSRSLHLTWPGSGMDKQFRAQSDLATWSWVTSCWTWGRSRRLLANPPVGALWSQVTRMPRLRTESISQPGGGARIIPGTTSLTDSDLSPTQPGHRHALLAPCRHGTSRERPRGSLHGSSSTGPTLTPNSIGSQWPLSRS